MLLGYVRVAKSADNDTLNSQIDELKRAGVTDACVFKDRAAGKADARPGLEQCLASLKEGDTLIVTTLDRLGRDTRHLLDMLHDFIARKIKFKVLHNESAVIDTDNPEAIAFIQAFADCQRELTQERYQDGAAAAKASGRKNGRRPRVTVDIVKNASLALKQSNTNVTELCKILKISRATLGRYVGPDGTILPHAYKVLGQFELDATAQPEPLKPIDIVVPFQRRPKRARIRLPTSQIAQQA